MTSGMRSHIKSYARMHFVKYRTLCEANNIEPNSTATPDSNSTGTRTVQMSIDGFTAVEERSAAKEQTNVPPFSAEGLISHLVELITIENLVSSHLIGFKLTYTDKVVVS